MEMNVGRLLRAAAFLEIERLQRELEEGNNGA